jgi:membrane glycosyltransferase
LRTRLSVALLTLALTVAPRLAHACPVCFGGPESLQTRGAQAGILALLVVTLVMLASIAGFFIYLGRRIRMFEESNGESG